ncbi:unnamed protein product [Durusdinium trenchii]|uniref:Uncharacterized protein n=1 Tax=Durusdinium trenchii TaxID=1381693 RepID=A0ABP0L4H6_9DINO
MASVTVKVTAGTEVQGKSGKLVMYLHDQALADAAATVTAEHALSMSDETVTLDANPESGPLTLGTHVRSHLVKEEDVLQPRRAEEQIGKKAKDMVQPSYYICVRMDTAPTSSSVFVPFWRLGLRSLVRGHG